jgi:cytochrome c oxidase subunit 2
MIRRRWAGLVGLALVLAACASDAPQDSLDPAGPEARQIDNLFNPVMIVAAIVFFLVQGLILFAVIKFRRKEGDDEFPDQVHGNTRLEIGWTILPALVLGVVAIFTVPVIFDLMDEPEDALQIEVTGQKYWWGYTYGEGSGATERAFSTANELHIPVDTPVFLTLHSNDVIHSFWAPRLNGKRDVVPGRTHTWTLQADEPGAYSGQCAEFCGTSHANMRLKVVAHTQADYETWLQQQQAEPAVPASGAEAVGHELFQQKGCAGCHAVDGQWDEVAEDSPPAPNLTHLFSRTCFAGCIYDLDRNELEAWLRDPQRKAGSLMVIGELSEAEIDNLYAYLRTLE